MMNSNVEELIEKARIELASLRSVGLHDRECQKFEREALSDATRRMQEKLQQTVQLKALRRMPIDEYYKSMRHVSPKETRYILNLQAKLCRSLHIMGILEGQISVLREGCLDRISSMQAASEQQAEDSSHAQLQAINELSAVETKKSAMEVKYNTIIKEQDAIIEKLTREAWDNARDEFSFGDSPSSRNSSKHQTPTSSERVLWSIQEHNAPKHMITGSDYVNDLFLPSLKEGQNKTGQLASMLAHYSPSTEDKPKADDESIARSAQIYIMDPKEFQRHVGNSSFEDDETLLGPVEAELKARKPWRKTSSLPYMELPLKVTHEIKRKLKCNNVEDTQDNHIEERQSNKEQALDNNLEERQFGKEKIEGEYCLEGKEVSTPKIKPKVRQDLAERLGLMGDGTDIRLFTKYSKKSKAVMKKTRRSSPVVQESEELLPTAPETQKLAFKMNQMMEKVQALMDEQAESPTSVRIEIEAGTPDAQTKQLSIPPSVNTCKEKHD